MLFTYIYDNLFNNKLKYMEFYNKLNETPITTIFTIKKQFLCIQI